MTTRISTINGDEFFIGDDFDGIMDKVAPTGGGPSSAIEARGACIHIDAVTGKRHFIAPQSITSVSEDVDGSE